MKAHMMSDTCYSTLNGGHNPFNFDGVARDTPSPFALGLTKQLKGGL